MFSNLFFFALMFSNLYNLRSHELTISFIWLNDPQISWNKVLWTFLFNFNLIFLSWLLSLGNCAALGMYLVLYFYSFPLILKIICSTLSNWFCPFLFIYLFFVCLCIGLLCPIIAATKCAVQFRVSSGIQKGSSSSRRLSFRVQIQNRKSGPMSYWQFTVWRMV